ncbi:MAG: NIPSNAP family protein [Alphaproteobacteria bacterium]
MPRSSLLASALIGVSLVFAACASAAPPPAPPAQSVNRAPAGTLGPARNQVPQAGEEITTIRYWKIRKGSFPEFLKASQTGVWPYFEKIGARVVGMWLVTPGPDGKAASPDYDEVYLMTRYASLAHWAATRNAAAMGGDGPDYAAMQAALKVRDSLSIETKLTFMKGFVGPLPPVFLPGTGEHFAPAH